MARQETRRDRDAVGVEGQVIGRVSLLQPTIGCLGQRCELPRPLWCIGKCVFYCSTQNLEGDTAKIAG